MAVSVKLPLPHSRGVRYTVQIELDGVMAASECIKKIIEADAVCNQCVDTVAITKADCKETSGNLPTLYDLTSLQKGANRVIGGTAALDYTQNLYEKKPVNYPYTDSCYLMNDMAPSLDTLIVFCFSIRCVQEILAVLFP